MSLREYFREATDLARYQWRAFALAVAALFALFGGMWMIPPGPITAVMMIPACVVILLTAMARANDIGPEHMSWVWQVRRIGLVIAGSGAIMYMASPWAVGGEPVPWRAVALAYGVALTWLTTPILPPWWDYMTGKYRENTSLRGHVGRFSGAGRKTGDLDSAALNKKLRRGDGEGS